MKMNSQKVCNFIKKETPKQAFFCEFCKIFKNTFLTEHPRATELFSNQKYYFKLFARYLATDFEALYEKSFMLHHDFIT